MRTLAVFCSGYGSNFQAILDAIKKKKLKARIAVMVCDNPKAYAIVRARKNRIPVVVLSPRLFSTRRAYERVLVSILKNEEVDLVILAGFMRILTPYIIRVFKNRIINIHPSLLPSFKGAHAIRDAYEAHAKVTGVSVHVVTKDVDAGRVLAQKEVKILKKDTLAALEKKIHRLEYKIYPRSIAGYLLKIGKFKSSG